jgi:conjugative transposon TraN protein
MKWYCAVWLVLVSICSFSQTSVEPYRLQICCNKTTNIIFPYEIKSVDRGTRDVLVQKAKGAENVLQIKAAKENFSPTNISVITAEGRLFSFIVDYTVDPAVLNFSFSGDSTVHFKGEPFNRATLENVSEQILGQKNFLHISSRNEQMKLSLKGIYIEKGALWFWLRLSNRSLIDYHPDYIRFFIQDKRKAKRTAAQRAELEPIYPVAITVIEGESRKSLVFGFHEFTLAKDKRLVCQITERAGGRLLKLNIPHWAILKARVPISLTTTR